MDDSGDVRRRAGKGNTTDDEHEEDLRRLERIQALKKEVALREKHRPLFSPRQRLMLFFSVFGLCTFAATFGYEWYTGESTQLDAVEEQLVAALGIIYDPEDRGSQRDEDILIQCLWALDAYYNNFFDYDVYVIHEGTISESLQERLRLATYSRLYFLDCQGLKYGVKEVLTGHTLVARKLVPNARYLMYLDYRKHLKVIVNSDIFTGMAKRGIAFIGRSRPLKTQFTPEEVHPTLRGPSAATLPLNSTHRYVPTKPNQRKVVFPRDLGKLLIRHLSETNVDNISRSKRETIESLMSENIDQDLMGLDDGFAVVDIIKMSDVGPSAFLQTALERGTDEGIGAVHLLYLAARFFIHEAACAFLRKDTIILSSDMENVRSLHPDRRYELILSKAPNI